MSMSSCPSSPGSSRGQALLIVVIETKVQNFCLVRNNDNKQSLTPYCHIADPVLMGQALIIRILSIMATAKS